MRLHGHTRQLKYVAWPFFSAFTTLLKAGWSFNMRRCSDFRQRYFLGTSLSYRLPTFSLNSRKPTTHTRKITEETYNAIQRKKDKPKKQRTTKHIKFIKNNNIAKHTAPNSLRSPILHLIHQLPTQTLQIRRIEHHMTSRSRLT